MNDSVQGSECSETGRRSFPARNPGCRAYGDVTFSLYLVGLAVFGVFHLHGLDLLTWYYGESQDQEVTRDLAFTINRIALIAFIVIPILFILFRKRRWSDSPLFEADDVGLFLEFDDRKYQIRWDEIECAFNVGDCERVRLPLEDKPFAGHWDKDLTNMVAVRLRDPERYTGRHKLKRSRYGYDLLLQLPKNYWGKEPILFPVINRYIHVTEAPRDISKYAEWTAMDYIYVGLVLVLIPFCLFELVVKLLLLFKTY